MDTGWAAPLIIAGKRAYFIHTQENGLTGQTSDSFWRRTGGVHQKLERSVVARADQVVVFNEDYAGVVARWNEDAQYSPTWFDPDLIDTSAADSEHVPHRIIWVGRLEVPKDPRLALEAFAALLTREPDAAWSLQMLGSGTLLPELGEYVDSLPADVRQRIQLRGRVAPAEVAEAMRTAGVFLMTSHPGYEGYPRVLVESLASGLPAVVTEGSDTGHLIADGEAGYVTDRDPNTIADRLIAAACLDRAVARAAAAHLSAPKVINDIYERTPSGAS
jgi:glycosyltransferase involved in cell wall biosynthesis